MQPRNHNASPETNLTGSVVSAFVSGVWSGIFRGSFLTQLFSGKFRAVSISHGPIRHMNRAYFKALPRKEGKAMAGIIELILFAGICLVVLGLGSGLPIQRSQSGGPFLDALAEALRKNSAEKVMQRVDSAPRRSTCM
jgi:hypothetical protein